jgi:hypothetical protein
MQPTRCPRAPLVGRQRRTIRVRSVRPVYTESAKVSRCGQRARTAASAPAPGRAAAAYEPPPAWLLADQDRGRGRHVPGRRELVLPLTTVENSDFSPSGLTVHSSLLMIKKLCLPHIFSCEDRSGSPCVRVLARGLPPARVFRGLGVWTGSLFGLPPHKEEPRAAGSPVCGTASLPRRLPRLSSGLPCLVVWRASACGCRGPGVRSKAAEDHPKAETPKGSLVPTPSARTSATLKLTSTPWSATASMARPNQCRRFGVRPAIPRSRARRTTPLSRLKPPSQKVAMVVSALAEGLDPCAAERVAGLPSGHHHHLADSRGLARSEVAQALASRNLHLPPVQLDERRTRLRCATQVRLSLAGDRPLHQDASAASSGPPHAKRRAQGHPLPATKPGPRLSPTFHE